MKRINLTLIALLVAFSAFSQTAPVNKIRSNDSFTQVDNYLIALKRLGIPTAESDVLAGTSTSQNSAKIIYNRTLQKLRIYDPVTQTWRDALEVDLTNYYTKAEVDALIANIPTETPTLSQVLAQGNSAGAKITNLSAPTDNLDAANKKYVDDQSILVLNVNTIADRRTSGYSTSNSNFFGDGAGRNASNANNSNFFGIGAGINALDANSSNFFGNGAGNSATGAARSNFFGNNAGYSATNANFSNFFGENSGRNASSANNSNFFGRASGQGAENARNSNFFGYNTGRTFTGNDVGSNNIIIGTNISLPNAASNSINIGGILFGTGTQSAVTFDPRIVPTSGGKIGIGVVSPTYNFEVNGTAGYTSDVSSTYTDRSFVDKKYVDDAISGLPTDIPTLQQVLAQGNSAGAKITNLSAPTIGSDAANKDYVDDQSVIEPLDEGNGTGYRVRGRDPLFYGNIGSNAVDFSNSTSISADNGATGLRSVAFGTNAKSSGNSSVSFSGTASGTASVSFGGGTASGTASVSFGGLSSGKRSTSFGSLSNSANSTNTLVSGLGVTANSPHLSVFGRYNDPIVPAPTVTFSNGMPIFIIGNGESSSTRRNSITVYGGSLATLGKTMDVLSDIEIIKAAGGLILRSPDGSRYRISVSNTGELTTTAL